ncbi:hypothetical protein CN326_08365 [Bacillus sp. AFS018417]|uniref:hypothetical protein n=1 Tax=Bacillus sp. AFS018417 TaxID=2033491 RepID=UPI000BF7EC34|nr:hypothetical protein [Bacillus sp. AFS018417]PEZ07574.1 hypothetical protein CN326_08365 [Bacillus sp. AFS018417]
MNNKFLGFIFVSVGLIFLMLSLTVPSPTALWAVSLGTSIVMNITGTTILMKCIKTAKEGL